MRENMKKNKIGALFELNNRYLCPIEREALPKIQKWRNAQLRILRQFRPLTSYDQERWFKELSEDKNKALFGIKTFNKSTKNNKQQKNK